MQAGFGPIEILLLKVRLKIFYLFLTVLGSTITALLLHFFEN